MRRLWRVLKLPSAPPKRGGAEQGPAALLLHEAPVSSAARAGLRRLSRRPLPSAAAVAPAGGGGGACRTVSIGPQVLVGAGAGAWAWAAEGAGLRAAVSRAELGLLSGRGTRRRRSQKPRASCSRRRCASPGRPRRQGPSARSPPAPRGLPGPGRSQVRSRSRGPRPPGPNASHGPTRAGEGGALSRLSSRFPESIPRGARLLRGGDGPGTGFGRWPLESFVRPGWGRGPVRGLLSSVVPGGSKNRLPLPSPREGGLRRATISF